MKKIDELENFKIYIDVNSCALSRNFIIRKFIYEKIKKIEININENGYLTDDFAINTYDKLFNKFHIIKETREFNSALFALTLLNSSILDKIISSGIYIEFCENVFYDRHFSNENNEIMVWDCVFNYFLNKFGNLYKSGFDRKIFEIIALEGKDRYFAAYCTAIDKFCVDHKIKVPIGIMEKFYYKKEKHYEKLKKMGIL